MKKKKTNMPEKKRIKCKKRHFNDDDDKYIKTAIFRCSNVSMSRSYSIVNCVWIYDNMWNDS